MTIELYIVIYYLITLAIYWVWLGYVNEKVFETREDVILAAFVGVVFAFLIVPALLFFKIGEFMREGVY